MAIATTEVARYEEVVAELLEQINLGRSYEDLFNSIYERLRGIVPYDRIAVALLEDAGTGSTWSRAARMAPFG